MSCDVGEVTERLENELCPTTNPRGPGSIPGYTLEIFLEVQDLEQGSLSLVRTIGYLLHMTSSEIRLRKLNLGLRDNALLTTRPLYCYLAETASVGLGTSEL